MKGKMQQVSHVINEAMFEACLILATGLFRAQRRTLLMPECHEFSERRLDSLANSSVHSMKASARGEKL